MFEHTRTNNQIEFTITERQALTHICHNIHVGACNDIRGCDMPGKPPSSGADIKYFACGMHLLKQFFRRVKVHRRWSHPTPSTAMLYANPWFCNQRHPMRGNNRRNQICARVTVTSP